ncbi:MAG: phosphatase [Pseudomonadales bacterium]|nr:MAG: phosphatase [Pseudomonadales bacterium]
MQLTQRVFLVLLLMVYLAPAQAEHGEPPVNMVEISDTLTTSGQPQAAYFDALAEQGFELIVNLAPPESHGSLENEGGLVGERGMTYVNIPVNWDAPAEEHFEFFRKVMAESRPMNTLVHCQVGFRASTFTFLFRVIEEGVEPDEALESVHAAWVPNETWTEFANRFLSEHGIGYQLDIE